MSQILKVIETGGEETAKPYLLRTAGWTEERYFAEAPETRFVEFEDGEVIMHSPANLKHQELTQFLTFLIFAFVQEHRLGKVFNGPAVVRLRENLNYEPDIFFVPIRLYNHLRPQYFMGPPPFILEVISEGTRVHDLKSKAENYRECGVSDYWAIDPEHKILHIHLLPDDRTLPYAIIKQGAGRLHSSSIAAFWIDVNWLWQEPLPSAMECLNLILAR